PDMIVHLPNGLDVVVDSKAPMDAYLRAVEAKDEDSRNALLADHARQFRDKIRQLSSKKYVEQLDVTPEFTVLFVPFESLFSAALSSDPDLIGFGMKNGVVIATPTTLIALLMAVSKGWQDKAIADNALELKNECAALYDSVCVFIGHYASVGAGLEKAIESFNKSVGSIQVRVMPKLARMNELGGFDKDGAKLGKKEIAEIAESHARELPAPGQTA
ncbi:MAG TPA: DNA recombination protein RmuC, partial [Opitutales bacterium]|nr:DNA recombination protein RmuC [Opitutales bacterium]